MVSRVVFRKPMFPVFKLSLSKSVFTIHNQVPYTIFQQVTLVLSRSYIDPETL